MSIIFLATGDVTLGKNKRDKDGNVTEQSGATFEEKDSGCCVVVGKLNPDTMQPEGDISVFGEYQASGYLAETLQRLNPSRQLDIPDIKEIFKRAAEDGVDPCDYCPSFLHCRDCIVTRWKEEP